MGQGARHLKGLAAVVSVGDGGCCDRGGMNAVTEVGVAAIREAGMAAVAEREGLQGLHHCLAQPPWHSLTVGWQGGV